METATEEAAAVAVTPCLNTDVIAKGKRTKRQRPNSPFSFTITPPRAASEESTTTEEADTARCLILLSQGHFIPIAKSRRDAAAMYTCKTCNRSFQSFQALGGHRASHKKPKNEKRYAIFSDEEDFNKFSPTSLSLQLSSVSTTATAAAMKSPRVHECSYCGAEFASGQALGGHMRKHRGGAAPPVPTNIREAIVYDEAEAETEAEERKKGGNWLSLDLNLPAPDDERSPNRMAQPLPLNR
ncbi:zinc finger protein ZAT5-like [Salvia hispanica]|uniref:zinc finger protein ZAT5-like n=1 Tax=Salvia hispanica TaxID=49212 RepID=UPI0020095D40|nr:zinc finger protein ZAT5-like [Salvia hispanica]